MTSYRRAVTPLITNPDVYRHRHPSSENARSPLRRSPGSSTVQCTTSMIPAVPLNVAPTARSSFFLAHACHSTATIERNQPLLPHTPASLILSSHALTNPPNLLSDVYRTRTPAPFRRPCFPRSSKYARSHYGSHTPKPASRTRLRVFWDCQLLHFPP